MFLEISYIEGEVHIAEQRLILEIIYAYETT